MHEDVLVSVIMPTCGRSSYLKRAADSVLSQTHRAVELVVINDNIPGSEEDIKTEELLSAMSAADKRMRMIHTSGRTGGGAARNAGLSECRGEYIAFLDDDDRYLPDKIEKQLEFTIECGLDMSYQDIQWFDENERLVEYRKQDRVRDFSKDGLIKAHLLASIAPTSIYMVKRSALTGSCLFGEVPRGQDFYFMANCIQAGLRIGYMPGAYVVQYLHEGERISVGPNFIRNVTAEWEDKKRLAEGLLGKRELRLMDFRLNCVCGFACIRGHEKGKAIPYFIKAFALSPAASFREAARFFAKPKK